MGEIGEALGILKAIVALSIPAGLGGFIAGNLIGQQACVEGTVVGGGIGVFLIVLMAVRRWQRVEGQVAHYIRVGKIRPPGPDPRTGRRSWPD